MHKPAPHRFASSVESQPRNTKRRAAKRLEPQRPGPYASDHRRKPKTEPAIATIKPYSHGSSLWPRLKPSSRPPSSPTIPTCWQIDDPRKPYRPAFPPAFDCARRNSYPRLYLPRRMTPGKADVVTYALWANSSVRSANDLLHCHLCTLVCRPPALHRLDGNVAGLAQCT